MLVAIDLVYMIMVILFRSLLVLLVNLCALPLAIIGALLVTGITAGVCFTYSVANGLYDVALAPHDFKGLAPGTVRDAGYFYYHTGERQPYATPSLVLAESPIDAMSIHALRVLADERGRLTVLSTDGAGALPTALIDKALAHGWTVQAGFDNDRAGDQLWQRLKEQYAQETEQGAIWRERPPHGNDWNDSLRYMLQERVQAPDRDEHDR